MKSFISFCLFFSASFSCIAQLYRSDNGKVSFFSFAPLENIDATSNKLSSILNPSTNEIVFTVRISTFKFKKAKMQEHFNEKYLESDKYPRATYKGTIKEKIDWKKDGTYKVISTGVLTIHNVPKERTDTATAIIKNGQISIDGKFMVAIADHKISVPKIVFQHIADVVTVKFTNTYSLIK